MPGVEWRRWIQIRGTPSVSESGKERRGRAGEACRGAVCRHDGHGRRRAGHRAAARARTGLPGAERHGERCHSRDRRHGLQQYPCAAQPEHRCRLRRGRGAARPGADAVPDGAESAASDESASGSAGAAQRRRQSDGRADRGEREAARRRTSWTNLRGSSSSRCRSSGTIGTTGTCSTSRKTSTR